MRQRKIIHIDMDAFYAAVEQRDNPSYRGKPLVVGGPHDGRGVVATCSYEARRFGIHSAMPSAHAYRLCPQAIFLRPRFDVYRAVSRQILAIFHQYTSRVEPLSLDEAYLDVTGVPGLHGSATLIARDIKRNIRTRTGLTASAGVSYNKFLAKIASDLDKPDGLYLIRPEEGPRFVQSLPVGRIHGVGPATEARMRRLGIESGGDLLRWSVSELEQHFGKAGRYYYSLARGIDERPVVSHRPRKSLGSETTFPGDLERPEEMLDWLERLGCEVLDTALARGLLAHTLTIKVKYADFRQVTRSHSRPTVYRTPEDIRPVLAALLVRTQAGSCPVRLLGVTLSGFVPAVVAGERAPMQLPLI